MPRNGTLDTTAALADAPHVLSTAGPSWDIADATLVQVNWEVDDDAALELTPPACHPSIPPFASFFAGRYPDTPVGTFNLAQARIVIRAGIRPRAFCLGAVCDNAEATEALRSNWGYPVEHGEVEVSVRHDRTLVAAAGRDPADRPRVRRAHGQPRGAPPAPARPRGTRHAGPVEAGRPDRRLLA